MDNNDLINAVEKVNDAMSGIGVDDFFSPFQPFAIQLGSDEIYYIHYLNDDFVIAFNIFKSPKDFARYDYHFHDPRNVNPLKRTELYFNQSYYSVIIENFQPDNLDTEIGPVQEYKPHKLPVPLKDEKEIAKTIEILEFLEKVLNSPVTHMDRLEQTFPMLNGRGVLPLIYPKGKGFDIGYIGFNEPEYKNDKFEKIIFEDDILISKLKQSEHRGDYLVEFFYTTIPCVDDEEDDEPYFVNGIVMFNTETGSLALIHVPFDFDTEPKKFIRYFAEQIMSFKGIPKSIHIRDEKTYNIVKDLFEKLDTKIFRDEFIPELDEVETQIFKIEHEDVSLTDSEWEQLLNPLETLKNINPLNQNNSKNKRGKLIPLPGDEKSSHDFLKNLIRSLEIMESEEDDENIDLSSQTNIKTVNYIAHVTGYGNFLIISPAGVFTSELIDELLRHCNEIRELPGWEDELFEVFKDRTLPRGYFDLEIGEEFEYHSSSLNLDILIFLASTSDEECKEITIKQLNFNSL